MGRESTVTIEQAFAAADALKADGIKPTTRAVRERLGNTGSMGTITTMLQKWKTGQDSRATEALVLPPALQRALLDFMDRELAAARAMLEADLVELQQEVGDLATESERQAETISAQVEQLAALAAEKAATEGKAGQLAADLDRARDDAARERQGAELARTELAKAQLRLEAMPRLEADLAAVRAELVEVRQARIAAEQAAAVLKAQHDDQLARLVDAKEQADRAADHVAGLETAVATTVADLAKERAARAGAEQEAAVLAAQRSELAEQLADLEADLKTVRAELVEVRQARTTAEQTAAVLTSQKSDLAGHLVDVKAQAERVTDQLAKLQERDEKLTAELADAREQVAGLRGQLAAGEKSKT